MAAPFNVRKGIGFTVQAVGILIGILGTSAYAMEKDAPTSANLINAVPIVPALGVSQAREPQLQLVLALAESRKESGQRVNEAQMQSSAWRDEDTSLSPPAALLAKLSAPDEIRLARLSANKKKQAPKPAPSGIPASETLPGKESSSASDSATAPISTPMPAVSLTTWDIATTDRTLNAALARWAAAAGWQLVWELPVDYPVETRATISGTFDEAILLVAKSLETAEVPIKAIFYDGNKVLRIVAKGSE